LVVKSTFVTVLVAAAVAVAACSSETAADPSRPAPVPSNDAPVDDPSGRGTKPKAVDGGVDAGPTIRNVDGTVDPTRPAFQTKSAAQLRASVEACVGAGALNIAASMLQGAAAPVPGAQPGFLPTSSFAAGTDIIDVQKALFDGSEDSLKTGIRTDQLSLEYLTALKNVANVVAANAIAGAVTTPALSQCATTVQALDLVTRCYGAVVSASTPAFGAIVTEISTACSATLPDGGTGAPAGVTAARAAAVASLIASPAFAKLP
jgi:hypothetical protein